MQKYRVMDQILVTIIEHDISNEKIPVQQTQNGAEQTSGIPAIILSGTGSTPQSSEAIIFAPSPTALETSANANLNTPNGDEPRKEASDIQQAVDEVLIVQNKDLEQAVPITTGAEEKTAAEEGVTNYVDLTDQDSQSAPNTAESECKEPEPKVNPIIINKEIQNSTSAGDTTDCTQSMMSESVSNENHNTADAHVDVSNNDVDSTAPNDQAINMDAGNLFPADSTSIASQISQHPTQTQNDVTINPEVASDTGTDAGNGKESVVSIEYIPDNIKCISSEANSTLPVPNTKVDTPSPPHTTMVNNLVTGEEALKAADEMQQVLGFVPIVVSTPDVASPFISKTNTLEDSSLHDDAEARAMELSRGKGDKSPAKAEWVNAPTDGDSGSLDNVPAQVSSQHVPKETAHSDKGTQEVNYGNSEIDEPPREPNEPHQEQTDEDQVSEHADMSDDFAAFAVGEPRGGTESSTQTSESIHQTSSQVSGKDTEPKIPSIAWGSDPIRDELSESGNEPDGENLLVHKSSTHVEEKKQNVSIEPVNGDHPKITLEEKYTVETKVDESEINASNTSLVSCGPESQVKENKGETGSSGLESVHHSKSALE